MGVLADAALAAGGEVVGVIPQSLVDREIAHAGLSRLDIVPDMLTRKARMAALADVFVALPGGYGTLDELFEMVTWTQIGAHTKPCGVLNVEGFYDDLLSWIAHAGDRGFIRAGHRGLLVARRQDTRTFRQARFMDVSRGSAQLNPCGAESRVAVSKIFVYGTLKPGGRNYFLAVGVTHTEPAYVEGYKLLHFEPEGYPAMVPAPEGPSAGRVLWFRPDVCRHRAQRFRLWTRSRVSISQPARVRARRCERATVGRNCLDLRVRQQGAFSRFRHHLYCQR